MSSIRTIVICCAGKGTRLGLDKTKALIEINNKPLIIYHLEKLKEEDDIRIVVGYQAEELIKVVKEYNPNVKFYYNNDYEITKSGDSVVCALKDARKYTLILDGDIIIEPNSMKNILNETGEFVCGTKPSSVDGWFEIIENGNVLGFSRNSSNVEWNGVTQIETNKIINSSGHIFQMIEPYLPIKSIQIDTKEIDFMEDYIKAKEWVDNDYKDL